MNVEYERLIRWWLIKIIHQVILDKVVTNYQLQSMKKLESNLFAVFSFLFDRIDPDLHPYPIAADQMMLMLMSISLVFALHRKVCLPMLRIDLFLFVILWMRKKQCFHHSASLISNIDSKNFAPQILFFVRYPTFRSEVSIKKKERSQKLNSIAIKII